MGYRGISDNYCLFTRSRFIWISKQPKRDKIQINPVKDGTSSFGGVNQGRRFKFSENVAAAYQVPTSKEELDFIVASNSVPENLNLISRVIRQQDT